jgi:hypothetical protein
MDLDDQKPPKAEYDPYLTPMRPYVVMFVVITVAVLFAGWLFSQ